MFASNSPYSPFFTSGLLSHAIFSLTTEPEYRSFLSLDLPDRNPRFSSSDSDSLRSIPSPKPAPSATLPDLPKSPALPSPSLTISRTPAPLTAIRRLSVATKATSSSVSTRARKLNRSEALARLEGRSKHLPITLHIKHLKPQQCNFMNMTDEEDEDDTDLDGPNFDLVFSNPVLEPEDVVLPTSFLPRSAPQNDSYSVRVPSAKDWLPLTSFIDLHNDDDSSSWTWRSFIQVANIS